LVGLEVSNEAGESLGRVASLIGGAAHDVLVVRDERGQERLLPFVAAVVRDVNRAGGRIRVVWQVDW
jgi:16S rRNA processing protein RimM